MQLPIDDLKGLPKELVLPALERLNRKADYWEALLERSTDLKPSYHQAKAAFETLEGGDGRVLFAHATGSGKTFTTFLIKAGFEEKVGRPARVVVWSPEQAIRTAWSQEELDTYSKSFGVDSQKRVHLEGRKSLSELKEYDFLELNYHKFGYLNPRAGSHNPYFDFIQELVRTPDLRPDIFVVDEVQNLKAPSSNRTLWFKELEEATRDSDIMWVLLSAYPVPNRLGDAGVPLYLLDPANFPLARFDYRSNPQAIRSMIQKGKWQNFTRDQLRNLFDLPELTEEQVPIEMDERHVRQYMETWKNGDMHLWKKLHALQRISIDAGYDGLRSAIGDRLAEDGNSQFLIFSDLKTGIFDHLYDLLKPFSPYRDINVIEESTPFNRRVKMARAFREGRASIQINTSQIMGEGVPLNTENRCYVIYLTPPSVPGPYHQGIGRVYRRNQKAPVGVLELVPRSSQLAELMTASRPELEARYNIQFPGSWTPTTIAEDQRSIRLTKEIIYNDKVVRGSDITELEENLMNTDDKNVGDVQHSTHLTGIPPISPEQIQRAVMIGFAREVELYGAGSREVQEASQGQGKYATPQKILVNTYSHTEKFLPQARIGYFVRRVVDNLEKSRDRRFEHVLDIGSGSGTIAYALERPVVSFDVDPRMLQQAQHVLHDKDGMSYVRGNMVDLPFRRETFDLAIASNSLMYLAQRPDNGDFRREMEQALMEVNRVLQEGGTFITTLPHKRTTAQIFENFNRLLELHGFDIRYADYDSVYATTDAGKRRLYQRTFLTIAEKKDYIQGMVEGLTLPMYLPTSYSFIGGVGRYMFGDIPVKSDVGQKFVTIGKRSGLVEF